MKYWKRVNKKGETTTVESYSHNKVIPGAIEITVEEYDAFIASLPEPEIPVVRDLAKELDALKAELIQKGVL